jgi:hypothetical protein
MADQPLNNVTVGKIFSMADKLGVSRVDFLEQLTSKVCVLYSILTDLLLT